MHFRQTHPQQLFLELSNYKPFQYIQSSSQCIKQLIFMRKYKQFTIEKPNLNFNPNLDQQWFNANKNKFGSFFEEESEKEKQKNILVQKRLRDQEQVIIGGGKLQCEVNGRQKKVINTAVDKIPFKTLKKKIIKKVKSATVNKSKQLQIQKSYSKYLLNYLHKTNLIMINRGIPPFLSVLQTMDQGDYLQDGQKKQYPHYSNVIQPIQLPKPQNNVKFIRQPIKHRKCGHLFTLQDNIIFKIKHIYLFISHLFSQSIYICQTIRQMNFGGDNSLKLQNQNHDFQYIGSLIGLSYQRTKLIYDILNDHYDIEKQLEIGKSDDYKVKICEEIKILVKNQIEQYFEQKIVNSNVNKYSIWVSKYVPIEECYLSLKQLRIIFLDVYDQNKNKKVNSIINNNSSNNGNVNRNVSGSTNSLKI